MRTKHNLKQTAQLCALTTFDSKNYVITTPYPIAHCAGRNKTPQYQVPTKTKRSKLKQAWGV